MDYSIFHFFAHLAKNSYDLRSNEKLEEFPFDVNMLSYRSSGRFPDMAIKLNTTNSCFTGGEFIEIKDSKDLSIASFNSTIPSGNKVIQELLGGERNMLRDQMREAGNDIDSLPIRDVFYLVRARKHNRICLVHGGFFETMQHTDLIKESFSQILDERENDKGISLGNDIKRRVIELFDNRDSIAKVRHIDGASVNLRFRIMAEVNKYGNILKYEGIDDNTLTFVAPINQSKNSTYYSDKLQQAYKDFDLELNETNVFEITHMRNGPFYAYQEVMR